MSDLVNRLKSGANKVATEAEKAARVTKAQAEVAALKHRLDGVYSDLGRVVYSLRQKKEGNPAAIEELCQKIAAQLQLIEQREQAIRDLQTGR